MSNKLININGNLNIAENLSIQGNLNVKGSTNTVNQETLTIKDNLITINGGGAPLTTAGMAGIIAVTGANQYVLNGNYMFDGQALFNTLNITAVYDGTVSHKEQYGPYRVKGDDNKIEKINSLCLSPSLVDGYTLNDCLNVGIGDSYSFYLYFGGGSFEGGSLTPIGCQRELSTKKDGTFDNWINWTGGSDKFLVTFKNQIIPGDDIDFILKFIKTENGSTLTSANLYTNGIELKGKAYAAPVYDVNDDTLKIGLGTYEKNENGDVISFDFGAG